MNASLARLLLSALAAGALCSAAANAQPVSVTREEPVVTRFEFDREHPPEHMPKLTPPEAGVCDTTFELSAGIGYSLELTSPGTVNIWVDKLDITTRLRMTIYTLAGAPQKLRAHEEGHRAISEHYYATAGIIARVAATPLIGKMFTGSGNDRAAAERDAQQQVLTALQETYMTRMRVSSVAANKLYDELTQHGLNGVDEADAVAQAIGGGAAAAGAR